MSDRSAVNDLRGASRTFDLPGAKAMAGGSMGVAEPRRGGGAACGLP
jgi:hypothetical protein